MADYEYEAGVQYQKLRTAGRTSDLNKIATVLDEVLVTIEGWENVSDALRGEIIQKKQLLRRDLTKEETQWLDGGGDISFRVNQPKTSSLGTPAVNVDPWFKWWSKKG